MDGTQSPQVGGHCGGLPPGGGTLSRESQTGGLRERGVRRKPLSAPVRESVQ